MRGADSAPRAGSCVAPRPRVLLLLLVDLRPKSSVPKRLRAKASILMLTAIHLKVRNPWNTAYQVGFKIQGSRPGEASS